MPDEIRFNRPAIEGDELEHVQRAVSGGHTAAAGPYSARVADCLRDAVGAVDCLMTTSCTAALEMSALLLDLQPGDRVIVPSFTFVTTALAFAREGASLVFCDIEEETLAADPSHVQTLLDDHVRAVVPVHYAGVACQLDALFEAVRHHPNVDVIEDNAHGLFGTYRDQPLGSFGRFAALSFHETKNFISGEGGALLINREADVDRAHVLYDKGTNRRAFMLGDVDKYSWQDLGSSFGMSDVLAAYLWGQLEQRAAIFDKRRRVFDHYMTALQSETQRLGFRTPEVPPDRQPAYHMFYVLLDRASRRDLVLRAMREQRINPTFHYTPLHSAPGAKPFLAYDTHCPVTDSVSSRLLRLPFHNNLSSSEIDRVVDVFLTALENHQ